MNSYLEEVRKFYKDNSLVTPIGCSAREVEKLEAELGESLPDAYKEYLLFMGADFNGSQMGTNCFLVDLLDNSRYLPDLLEENEIEFKLPEKYAAFFSHQGYIVAWFNLPKESEDPAVYFFSEGTTPVPEVYGSFSSFISRDVIGNAKLFLEQKKEKR